MSTETISAQSSPFHLEILDTENKHPHRQTRSLCPSFGVVDSLPRQVSLGARCQWAVCQGRVTWECPLWQARCRGAASWAFLVLALAPWRSSKAASSLWPCRAAMCRGVKPSWFETFTPSPLAQILENFCGGKHTIKLSKYSCFVFS